ncbi:MAG: dihydropteroate synthase [Actinomycetota bacterium]|nr:dihydropteroate synthase [Actinomycetota bacterium]
MLWRRVVGRSPRSWQLPPSSFSVRGLRSLGPSPGHGDPESHPRSFYDGGRYYALDDFLKHAERLVADGADLLDVGARPGGVGAHPVSENEECDLAVEAIESLRVRFDVPVSVDRWSARVAAAAFSAGAVLGNDMSGFRDPGFLPAAVAVGASVVATHIRRPPGEADPNPLYRDVVADVADALRALARHAVSAGVPPERVVVDPGLDLGKTSSQSLQLLASTEVLVRLGHPLLVAPATRSFSGELDLPKDDRGSATVAACTLAAVVGGRVLRVHDVRAGRHVAGLVATVLACRDEPRT